MFWKKRKECVIYLLYTDPATVNQTEELEVIEADFARNY